MKQDKILVCPSVHLGEKVSDQMIILDLKLMENSKECVKILSDLDVVLFAT